MQKFKRIWVLRDTFNGEAVLLQKDPPPKEQINKDVIINSKMHFWYHEYDIKNAKRSILK